VTANLIGYVRCSTDRHGLAAQRVALLDLGVAGNGITTTAEKPAPSRPGPEPPCATASPSWSRRWTASPTPPLTARAIGDCLVVRKVGLQFGMVGYDPADSLGEVFLIILATFAASAVDQRRLRTREGMAIVQAKGKLRRCAPRLSPTCQTHLVNLHAAAGHSIDDLAELVEVSRATMCRVPDRASAGGSR